MTQSEGLADDGTATFADDGAGSFWIGSDRGISRVSRAELADVLAGRAPVVHAVTFGRAEGMRSAECNSAGQPAALRLSDGRVLFATEDGIAIVDPKHLQSNPVAPIPAVESVDVDGLRVANAASVRLDRGANNLSIHYTAPSFVAPERIRFRHRLVGFDTGWVEAGTTRTATYSRLPPGRYRFDVAAANADGVWSEAPASIQVVVAAPFGRSPLVVGLLALAMLGLVGFAGWGRARFVRMESSLRRLEREVYVDAATGLANRRRLDETLASEWRRATRGGEISLVLVDVETPDREGMTAALRGIADAARASVGRTGDLAARLDPFTIALLLPASGESAVDVVTRRVTAAIAAALPAMPPPAIASATLRPTPGSAERMLVDAAEQALRARSAGRARRV